MKKSLVIVANYTQEKPLTLDELCEVCHISTDFIHNLIEYDIIHPYGTVPEEWVFDMMHLQRIKMALRLQHDLEVNLAGIALVLDLLDEMEELRARAEFLENYFMKP